MGNGDRETIERAATPATTPATTAATGSRLIGAIVAPAVKLWLRSQVESAAEISVSLDGRDREILTGRLPMARVAARGAVYQGLHLSAIDLVATEIAVNLSQVVRGKPLRLLQPIPVAADLRLSALDLAASLAAPLLAPALADFLRPLLAHWGRPVQFDRPQASLESGALVLAGVIEDRPVQLRLGLELASPQQLLLRDPCWRDGSGTWLGQADSVALPLGEDVMIETLSIEPDHLRCAGQITVRP